MIYLDWAATAPPDQNILEKTIDIARQYYGNPSSIHKEGQDAEKLLNESRQTIADCLGCLKEEVVFTSGGSESNNIIINSMLMLNRIREERFYSASNQLNPVNSVNTPNTLEAPKTFKVIISGIEHSSVYYSAMALKKWGITVKSINTSKSGIIDPCMVENELDENTKLVCIMMVNNETGAIQPISQITSMVRDYSNRIGRKIHIFTDAVQAFGKIPFNPKELDVDTASISSHKLGGPRGVGALYIKKGCYPEPIYKGGGQEKGLRPGTENLPGIYGFSLAAAKALLDLNGNLNKASGLMNTLCKELYTINDLTNNVKLLPAIRKTGKTHYSPYILKVSFPTIPGEVLVRMLSDKGICISTGSACFSRKRKEDKNYVLKNMGISEDLSDSAIRISIGHKTSLDDIYKLINILKKEMPFLIRISSNRCRYKSKTGKIDKNT